MEIKRYGNAHQVSVYDLINVSTGKMFALYYALKTVVPTTINQELLGQIETELIASGHLLTLGDIDVNPDQSYTKVKKQFILGYANDDVEVTTDGKNLTLYETADQAAFEATEWVIVEAATEQEARKKFEKTFFAWQQKQEKEQEKATKPNDIF